MTPRQRSLLATGVAVLAAGLFLWAAVTLGETFTGPPTVPVDYTPHSGPRSAP